MNEAIPFNETLLRVLAAVAAGALIGWERESHGRPAGLRTTTLACAAAAMAMILSQKLFVESAATASGGAWRPDPARLGAGILTGIGFLGAGTILRHNNLIRGVTTAASLWFVTVIGLAFGSGEFALGGVGVGVAAVALHVLPVVERHIQTDWYATLTVTMELDALDEPELRRRIQAPGVSIQSVEFSYDLAARRKTICFELKLKRRAASDLSSRLRAELGDCPGVTQVKWG